MHAMAGITSDVVSFSYRGSVVSASYQFSFSEYEELSSHDSLCLMDWCLLVGFVYSGLVLCCVFIGVPANVFYSTLLGTSGGHTPCSCNRLQKGLLPSD